MSCKTSRMVYMFSTSIPYYYYKRGIFLPNQRRHPDTSHTLKSFWSSKLQRLVFSSSSNLSYIKTWIFKYLRNSSNLPYQHLNKSVVDPRTNCEALGLAFEEKNRKKLSISLRKSWRLYSHIFLNLYIAYLLCIFLAFL